MFVCQSNEVLKCCKDNSINLTMNEGSLSCLSHCVTNHNDPCLALGTLGKSSMSRDALSWFHDVTTYGGEIIEYLTIFL
jgi:hypothetical protein